MKLPENKTKIVATIGPASMEPSVLEQMIRAGMNVARLNFSHGDFEQHGEIIKRVRAAACSVGRRVAIMADLPGPKMRLGEIEDGPIELHADEPFILTSEDIVGDRQRVSMSFEALPRVVKKGDRLFLNDGLVQLLVDRVEGNDVHCSVAVGGQLSSRKGLNLPRISLGIGAFTERDRECLAFAIEQGVDAVSQSFVETADDIEAVRTAASELGGSPFIIAKIERQEALENIEAILDASDGIMIARGDLGVEIPIETMAVTQKKLMKKAIAHAKPVITATQMLESMTSSRLPTRAEATDVANAILDGTDCVMLSGESAVGRFPVESVAMLAKISTSTEAYREENRQSGRAGAQSGELPRSIRKALLVDQAIELMPCDAVFVPVESGRTARTVARSRIPAWVVAVGLEPGILQGLSFCAGIHPHDLDAEPESWRDFARQWLEDFEIEPNHALLAAGPSSMNPDSNQRLEFFDFTDEPEPVFAKEVE
jgi:pyruvate kinase